MNKDFKIKKEIEAFLLETIEFQEAKNNQAFLTQEIDNGKIIPLSSMCYDDICDIANTYQILKDNEINFAMGFCRDVSANFIIQLSKGENYDDSEDPIIGFTIYFKKPKQYESIKNILAKWFNIEGSILLSYEDIINEFKKHQNKKLVKEQSSGLFTEQDVLNKLKKLKVLR